MAPHAAANPMGPNSTNVQNEAFKRHFYMLSFLFALPQRGILQAGLMGINNWALTEKKYGVNLLQALIYVLPLQENSVTFYNHQSM